MAAGWLNKHMPRSAFHLQSGFLPPCTHKSWVEVSKNHWLILFLNGESLCRLRFLSFEAVECVICFLSAAVRERNLVLNES